MPNRIALSIAKMKKQIEDRIAAGLVTQEKVDQHHKTLDMDLDEYCLFQEKKSLAFASGILTLDEATYVYGLLGTTPEHFNQLPVAEKAVLTKLFSELLSVQ